MDSRNYEDYMRSILGNNSNMNSSSMNCPNMNCPNSCMNNQSSCQNMAGFSDNLEKMYPDTYQIVFPMVVSTCSTIAMPISEEMLDKMTDDIYDRACTDGRISSDINMMMRTDSEEDSNYRQLPNSNRIPMRRNRFFRDFIRVLLIRELLRRRQGFPFRPF